MHPLLILERFYPSATEVDGNSFWPVGPIVDDDDSADPGRHHVGSIQQGLEPLPKLFRHIDLPQRQGGPNGFEPAPLAGLVSLQIGLLV
jgi:hypothetical protein